MTGRFSCVIAILNNEDNEIDRAMERERQRSNDLFAALKRIAGIDHNAGVTAAALAVEIAKSAIEYRGY